MQNIINPSNPADRVASDLIQAFKTSKAGMAWVSFGKVEVRVDKWGEEIGTARVQVNWPSPGPCYPTQALVFALDMQKAATVAAIVDSTLNSKPAEL